MSRAVHQPGVSAVRRGALRTAATAAAGAALVLSSTVAQADPEPGSAPVASSTSPADTYDYHFLSSPDFLNADIGDVKAAPGYRPGSPNSTNRRFDKALDVVFDAFAAEGAQDIAVAGDLVNGHWGKDTLHTGTFGPVTTPTQRRHAIKSAARLYYRQWVDRFVSRGLRPLAALGDHEIGDNPWRGRGGFGDAAANLFKLRSVPLFKSLFGKYVLEDRTGRRLFPEHPTGPAARTAYAVRLHPDVELISLDVFQQKGDDVVTKVDPAQMRWLRGVLRDLQHDGVGWTVVQFHTPIIGPVRERGSSGLMYAGGTRSALWKLLERSGVNLVLNGEVHDITAHQPQVGDAVQITHGGLFQYGFTNYLDIHVTDDSMSIVSKEFHKQVGQLHRLWQTDTAVDAPASVSYDPVPYVGGTMTLTKDGVITERSGKLAPYRGTP